MAAPSDMDSLRAAWRALASKRQDEGWRTIPITVRAPCTLFAGRRMPGGEEAMLIGFRTIRKVPDSHLPQGRGFEVFRLQADPTGDGRTMLALTRASIGSPELFAMMAEDLVDLLDRCATSEEEEVFQRFLARIRAWQDFMDRRKEGVLSAEAEQGLFGELVMLERMMDAGVPARDILDAWQGPLDGLQDFILGTGGIEVKTTLSAVGFLAMVSSLEQLDEDLRQPIFLAAVRLALHPSGTTLVEMSDAIRTRLGDNQAALEIFETRLMQAGLLRTAAGRYTRRFLHASSAILALQEDFPRLTRANVHPVIREAWYEIDLDLAGAEDIGLRGALESLGAI